MSVRPSSNFVFRRVCLKLQLLDSEDHDKLLWNAPIKSDDLWMLNGNAESHENAEENDVDRKSQVPLQTFEHETPIVDIDRDSNGNSCEGTDSQDSSIRSKESDPIRGTKKRQRSEETNNELVTDRESEDAPFKRRAVRRNAMIPNGLHAEIAKDITLIFQLDSISFVPYRSPDLLIPDSDDDSD